MTPIPPRPTGSFGRFKCWVTGTDPMLLGQCPQRDQDSVGAVFWLQVAVWLWQVLLFSLILHLMLAPTGIVRPELIGVAVLLATMIALLDSFMIIRSSWFFHGMAELKRGGLVLATDYGAMIKHAVFFTLRLLMAVAFSLLIGAFASILILDKDVTAKLREIQKEKNAPLLAAVTTQFDQDTDNLRTERNQTADAIAKAEDDASALRRSAATQPVDDPELKITADSLSRLEATRTAAETAFDRAKTVYAQESAAARRTTRGEAQAAAMRRASMRYSAAKDRFERATQQFHEARKHLADLRAGMATQTTRRNQLTDGRLDQAEASRKANVARLAAIDAELTRRTDAREAQIKRALEANPGHVGYDDGLLTRVQALHKLTADPFNASLVVLLDAVFFAIELAAVLAKSLTFIPSTYATLLAKEDYLRAHEAARDIAEQASRSGLSALNSDPSPRPAQDPPSSPEPPSTQQPDPANHTDDTDDTVAATAESDRHAQIRRSLRDAANLARARAAHASKPVTASAKPPEDRDPSPLRAAADPPRRPRGRPPGARTQPRTDQDSPASTPDRHLLRLVTEDTAPPGS